MHRNRPISFQTTRTAVAATLLAGFLLAMPIVGGVVALGILAADFVFLRKV